MSAWRHATVVACALLAFGAAAAADVRLEDGWVRASGPTQHETAAYVRITPQQALRLVQARSPWAASVRVRPVAGASAVRLPAGETTQLAPGGPDLLLVGLRYQVREGDVIPISLVLEDAQGRRLVRHFGGQGRAPGR
ncbi:hypothetical protein CLD22_23245 [Rubrivivax gelatinosus]|nr:hypothetical protein [Rubrivivax gelatinosus]